MNKVTPRCREIRIFMYVLTGKVQIFWEVQKNSSFAMTLLCNFFLRREIFSNFEAFSQYMNFIWISKPDETRHHEPIVVKTRFLIQFTSLTSVTKIKHSDFEMKIQVISHHALYFQYQMIDFWKVIKKKRTVWSYSQNSLFQQGVSFILYES